MRIRVNYSEYPHSPKATAHSLQQAQRGTALGFFANIVALVGVVYYITSAIGLFSEGNWLDLIKALGVLIAASALIFYTYYLHTAIADRECLIIVMKEKFSASPPEDVDRLAQEIRTVTNAQMLKAAKKFFLVFFGSLLIALCATGVVLGIYRLAHRQGGVELLLICLAGLGIVLFALIYSYRHLLARLEAKEASTAPPQEKSVVAPIDKDIQPIVRFCKTCGTKLLADSIFCANCGTQVRR